MDSLSQFVLGATVAQVTLGKKLGRRAMLLGGLLGTLPDLDVLVHYSDAVASFTFHRSWSHSLFVLSLASLPIAWLLMRFYPDKWLNNNGSVLARSGPPSYAMWLLCVFLVLTTHALLDGFTVYGTQLFWPLNVQPAAIGSIFIIDPIYTLPLLIALLVVIRKSNRAQQAVALGLILSSGYLVLTLVLKNVVQGIAQESLQKHNINAENVLVVPTPFSVLWRIVSVDNESYYEGFYSFLDQDRHIDFVPYNRNEALIDQHMEHWPVARMDWFTNGMISADIVDEQLVINDLRMGIESSYVFRFSVGQLRDSNFEPLESQQLPLQLNQERMRAIVRRAWDEDVNVLP